MKLFKPGNPYSIRDNCVEPGAWFVDPEKTADWVIAFLACPECGMANSLSCREFGITKEGVVDKEWACNQIKYDGTKCTFKDRITFDKWVPREFEQLFAICFQEYNPKRKRWEAKIDYTHAMHAAKARYIFQATLKNPHHVRGIVVGQSVGFFVDDNQGMQLSV